jgi:hypothetical protein
MVTIDIFKIATGVSRNYKHGCGRVTMKMEATRITTT